MLELFFIRFCVWGIIRVLILVRICLSGIFRDLGENVERKCRVKKLWGRL